MDLEDKVQLITNAQKALALAKAHFEAAYIAFNKDVEEGWKQENSGHIDLARVLNILNQIKE
jgi:hypothetical protein